jgi:hypothetical protein
LLEIDLVDGLYFLDHLRKAAVARVNELAPDSNKLCQLLAALLVDALLYLS